MHLPRYLLVWFQFEDGCETILNTCTPCPFLPGSGILWHLYATAAPKRGEEEEESKALFPEVSINKTYFVTPSSKLTLIPRVTTATSKMFYSAGRLTINHYKTGKNSSMWIPYQVFCSPFKRRDIDISICVRAGTYLRKYTKRAHCILWRHWIKSVGTRWRKTAVILGACAHRTCGTWNKAEEKRSKVKRSVGKIKIGGGFAISGQQGGGGAVAGSSFHKPELYGHSGPILPPLQPPAPPDQQFLRNVECNM